MPVVLKKFEYNEINVLVLENMHSFEMGMESWHHITDDFGGVGGDIILLKTDIGFDIINMGKKFISEDIKTNIIYKYYEMINEKANFIEIRLTEKFVNSLRNFNQIKCIA